MTILSVIPSTRASYNLLQVTALVVDYSGSKVVKHLLSRDSKKVQYIVRETFG